MKTILVDDNPYALSNLKNLLNKFDINVIAETTKAENVEKLILEYNPDVVFLDIDLQHKTENGITIADKVAKIKPDIIIIYATAHSEYAMQTFEADAFAVDYILKPFNKIKISRAIQKAKKLFAKKAIDSIKFKDKDDNVFFLKINDIVFIERENNVKNTIIHYGKEEIYVTESLQSLERRLSEYKQFIRSHKSYIINKNKVKSIEITHTNSFLINFWGCDKAALIVRNKKKLIS